MTHIKCPRCGGGGSKNEHMPSRFYQWCAACNKYFMYRLGEPDTSLPAPPHDPGRQG